jgi:hypothetical protein
MTDTTWKESLDEIWKLFKETDAKFKETDAKFKETDTRLDQRIAETDARLARQFADTDRKINRLEGLLGMQWGRFMEALVQPGVLHLFQERDIEVRHIYQRIKSQLEGDTLELDLLLENGDEVVVVEVKSKFTTSDVSDFLTDLGQLTRFFPRYQSYTIYGAVAGLEMPSDVGRYAYKQGLFVLAVEGEGLIQMKNDAKFKPKNFAL